MDDGSQCVVTGITPNGYRLIARWQLLRGHPIQALSCLLESFGWCPPFGQPPFVPPPPTDGVSQQEVV